MKSTTKQPVEPDKYKRAITIVFVLCLLFLTSTLVVFAYHFVRQSISDSLALWGQFGGVIGGIFGTAISLMAVFGVWKTYEGLQEQIDLLKKQNAEAEKARLENWHNRRLDDLYKTAEQTMDKFVFHDCGNQVHCGLSAMQHALLMQLYPKKYQNLDSPNVVPRNTENELNVIWFDVSRVWKSYQKITHYLSTYAQSADRPNGITTIELDYQKEQLRLRIPLLLLRFLQALVLHIEKQNIDSNGRTQFLDWARASRIYAHYPKPFKNTDQGRLYENFFDRVGESLSNGPVTDGHLTNTNMTAPYQTTYASNC